MKRKKERCLYSRKYYEEHRYKIAEHLIGDYLPRKIEQLYQEIPDKIEQYYEEYNYNAYLENYTNSILRKYGVGRTSSCHQDCVSNTYLGYMYAIGRCAYCGYAGNHVKNYIKLMIRVCIVNSINLSDYVGHICKENHLRVVHIDDSVNV